MIPDPLANGDIAPGVTGAVLSTPEGTAIYEWSGDGQGNTRAALKSLQPPITVIDPGQPGTDSYMYWQKMLGEGLVHRVLDDEDKDITDKMRPVVAPAANVLRDTLKVLESAKLCGQFLQQACREGRLPLLKAVEQQVGREKFREWLAEGGGAFVAAASSWRAEVFRFLQEVQGDVPYEHSVKFAHRFSFVEQQAVTCAALEAALGIPAVSTAEAIPLQDAKRCNPCVPIVQLILEAHPAIRPETLLARPLALGDGHLRFDSLLGWSMLIDSEPLQDLMMARKPNLSEQDLTCAIESRKVRLVQQMLSQKKVMPVAVLRAIGTMPHDEQVQVLRAAPRMPMGHSPHLADLVAHRYAGDAYRLMHEVFGVERQVLLMAAAMVGSPEGVREMASLGADVSAKYTEEGVTMGPPLHIAKDGDTVRALLECAADPNGLNQDGRTPLQDWLEDTPTSDRTKRLVDKIFRIAEGGADLAVKLGDKTLMRLAQKWPEEIRRTVKSAKMGVKLNSAMQPSELVPAAAPRADHLPL